MEITELPNITAVTPIVTLKAVQCGWLDCWLASLLVPNNIQSIDQAKVVVLNNSGTASASVSSPVFVLHGEKTNATIGTDGLTIVGLEDGKDQTLDGQAYTSLVIKLDPWKFNADRYQGPLNLKVDGTTSPLDVTVDFSVQNGPGLPLIVLVVSILIGRMARNLDSPTVQAQIKLKEKLDTIEFRSDSLTDRKARIYSSDKLKELRKDVDSMTELPEILEERVNKFELTIKILSRLELLETQVKGLSEETLKTKLNGLINDARNKAIVGTLEGIDQTMDDIQKQILDATPIGATKLVGGMVVDKYRDDVVGTLKEIKDAARDGNGAADREKELLARGSPNREIGKWIARVVPNRLKTAWFRITIQRPLVAIMVLIAVVLVGMQLVYVNVPTFGADGIWDYFTLFVWGVSVDVVTLSGIKALLG